MATRRWLSGAAAVSGVTSSTFGGTWLVGETVTLTIGENIVVVTGASTVIATIIDGIVTALTALNSSVYPEFAEQTYSRSSSALLMTAVTAGVPFTATVTTNSASGTIGAASVVTSSAGPNDWSTAANWSGATVPVAADTVVIEDGSQPILYGLNQSAVTLAELDIPANYTGTIGLPTTNSNGAASYAEYRDTYLRVSATVLNIGVGTGTGSGRIRIDVGSVACTASVYLTGSALDNNTESLQWKGTHANNVLNVTGNSQIGVATYGSELATLATLRMSGSAAVRCGSGVTLGTILNNGGTLIINSAVGTSLTHTEQGGITTINGSGAVAQLTVRGGNAVYNTSGTLGGNTIVSNTGVLDFSQDQRPKTVTNPILKYGDVCQVLDPNFVCNSGGNFIVTCTECTIAGLNLGTNVKITRAAP